MMASIRHPNVVQVFDFGITPAGRPYIAMERLQGHTLEDDIYTRGPWEPLRAIRFAIGALDGLAAAHARNIVHRDLKPTNLFVVDPGEPTERPCVLDFGLALLAERTTE